MQCIFIRQPGSRRPFSGAIRFSETHGTSGARANDDRIILDNAHGISKHGSSNTFGYEFSGAIESSNAHRISGARADDS